MTGLVLLYSSPFDGIDPSDFRKTYGVWIWVGIILSTILAAFNLLSLIIMNHVERRTSQSEHVGVFLLLAKTIHDSLFSWGAINPNDVEERLNRLEQSEDTVWISDEARNARSVFIDHARNALRVRSQYGEYRSSIERSETKEYLDNSKDRLIATLTKKKMPEFFDPYADLHLPWLRRLRFTLFSSKLMAPPLKKIRARGHSRGVSRTEKLDEAQKLIELIRLQKQHDITPEQFEVYRGLFGLKPKSGKSIGDDNNPVIGLFFEYEAIVSASLNRDEPDEKWVCTIEIFGENYETKKFEVVGIAVNLAFDTSEAAILHGQHLIDDLGVKCVDTRTEGL